MKRILAFRRSESGSVSIEAVLVFPLFFLVLGLMVDLSLIFNSEAEVLRVIQDANRNVSIGRITSTTSAEQYIENAISHLAPDAVAQSTIVAGVVTTTVKYPARDVMLTGFFDKLLTIELTQSAQHMIEDWEG